MKKYLEGDNMRGFERELREEFIGSGNRITTQSEDNLHLHPR